MKRLIIVRHGNTFAAGDTPTRVGRKTDLPLVEENLSRNAGRFLAKRGYAPNRAYAAPLKRTLQSARLILSETADPVEVEPLADFLEIDYGPDENKTEAEVITRLGRLYLEREGVSMITEDAVQQRGKEVIELWNQKAVVPDGWIVAPEQIVSTWRTFADRINDDETVLLVTSNGIIRFVPQILNASDYQAFSQTENLKVKTGGVSIFEHHGDGWQCVLWNVRPDSEGNN